MKLKKLHSAVLAFVMIGISFYSGCSSQEAHTEGNPNFSSWKTVVPFEYESVEVSEQGNFIAVTENSKYGVYAKKDDGYISLFPTEYDWVRWSDNEEYLFLLTNGSYQIFRAHGTNVTEQSFSDVSYNRRNNGFEVKLENENWGFLSDRGDWILEPEFVELSPLWVDDRFLVRKQDLKGDIVDSNGVSKFPSEYNIYSESCNYVIVFKPDNPLLHGITNLEGELIVPISYRTINIISVTDTEVVFLCTDQDDKKSVINESGAVALSSVDCDSLTPISPTKFIIKKQGKTGMLGKDGEIIYPCEYIAINYSEKSQRGLLYKGEEAYLFDNTGNKLGNSDYSSLTTVINEDELFLATKHEKYGYIDSAGNTAVPFEYDYGNTGVFNNTILVKKDGKFGYISPQNQSIISLEYLYASTFEKGFALVAKEDNKVGIIDLNGRCIVPFEFDLPSEANTNNVLMNRASNNLVPLNKDGKYGCIILQK